LANEVVVGQVHQVLLGASLFYRVNAAEPADHHLGLSRYKVLVDLDAEGLGPVVFAAGLDRWLELLDLARPKRDHVFGHVDDAVALPVRAALRTKLGVHDSIIAAGARGLQFGSVGVQFHGR
jgi:hypothetical protein